MYKDLTRFKAAEEYIRSFSYLGDRLKEDCKDTVGGGEKKLVDRLRSRAVELMTGGKWKVKRLILKNLERRRRKGSLLGRKRRQPTFSERSIAWRIGKTTTNRRHFLEKVWGWYINRYRKRSDTENYEVVFGRESVRTPLSRKRKKKRPREKETYLPSSGFGDRDIERGEVVPKYCG